MAAKEEDGNEEGMLGGLREMVQQLQEMISQDEAESNLSEKKDVGQGGENKLNSDETSNEQQGTSDHQLAGLSTTYNVLVAYKQSDVANLETRNVPLSSGEGVSSLSVPSSDLASKYNLPDDEEVMNPIDYSSSDYDAIRDQLSQLSIENDDSDDASLKKYMSKIDSCEHAPVNPAKAPTKPRLLRQNAMPRQRHTTELDPGYSASSLNQPMPIRYQLSRENDDDSDDASLKEYMSKIGSSSSNHLEAERAQYGTHEHASDFTFDVRQHPVNPAQAPPKPRLQRQNAMPRQRHTRELDPGYSASYLNQPMPTRDSITTSSSHGRRPPISMTKALTTATDFVPQRNQHYSQRQVPSGQYGNIMNSAYTPNQNEGYNNNMPPSAAAFQQHGGSNMAHNGNITNSPYLPPAPAVAASQQLGGSTNNTSAHYGNIIPEQNESNNYNMPPQSAASHAAPYAYGSVNIFGTYSSSDDVADSRFGYEGGVSRNHLPPIQQRQSTGDSNVWRPSFRRSQREQLLSEFFASLNQQNDRSDPPSDQTQERSWPKRDN